MGRSNGHRSNKEPQLKKKTENPLLPTQRTRPINYQPYELSTARDLCPADYTWLASQWSTLQIRQYTDPAAPIGAHTYIVPYKGEKNEPTLFSIAGKRQFDFFAYTFTLPSGGGTWDVMFDHETGLVRTMSVFRALGLEKSTPAEALKTTPGLHETSPNITGGRIPIQGFWIPYLAARELCLLFAGPIRAALWPVFGPAILQARDGGRGWAISPNVVGAAKVELATVRAQMRGEDERRDTPMDTQEGRVGCEVFGQAVEGRSDREIEAAVGLMMLKARDRVYSNLGYGEFRASEGSE